MVIRRQWVQLIEAAWRERPIAWLSGVRRVGKTCLGQSLPNVEHNGGRCLLSIPVIRY